MKRIAVAFVVGALALGCGGGDESPTDAASRLIEDAGNAADDVASGARDAASSAQNLAEDAAASAKKMAGDAASAVASQEVLDCLSTVTKGDFSQAVQVCQKALAAEPENAQVKSALETAQQGVAAAEEAGNRFSGAAGALATGASDAADAAQEELPATD